MDLPIKHSDFPYSRVERKMSSRVCTWPISLNQDDSDESVACWLAMSHGIGQKVHGRPVHPIEIITFSMPNALPMWLFWRNFQKLVTRNWMAPEGEHAKDRLDGANTADELAGFDDLLHNWFCAIPRFVLGSCSMTALQVGEVGPDVPVQKYSKDSRSI